MPTTLDLSAIPSSTPVGDENHRCTSPQTDVHAPTPEVDNQSDTSSIASRGNDDIADMDTLPSTNKVKNFFEKTFAKIKLFFEEKSKIFDREVRKYTLKDEFLPHVIIAGFIIGPGLFFVGLYAVSKSIIADLREKA